MKNYKIAILVFFVLITNNLFSQNTTLKYVGKTDYETSFEYYSENIITKYAKINLENNSLTYKASVNTNLLCNNIERRTSIYAEPNDSIFFTIDNNKLIDYYSNSNKYRKTESEFINECYLKYGPNETEKQKKITSMVATGEGFNLTNYNDNKYIKEQELLEDYLKNDKISKSFYKYYKNLFWCLTTNNLLDSNEDEIKTFSAIEQSFKKSDELLNLFQYRELVYNYSNILYSKTNSNKDLINNLQFIVSKKYPSVINDFLLFKSIKEHILENPDVSKINNKTKLYFKSNCKNNIYIKLIEKELQPTIIPEFINQIVKKNRGKLVLIDFWASWCLPCRAEFPSEKKLIKKHPEMAFIFFSIDEGEKNWQRAMSEYTDMLNKDNSFLLTKENNKEVADKLNVKSIPRYLLFDKEGKIITFDAPRPSSVDIENLINDYVNNK